MPTLLPALTSRFRGAMFGAALGEILGLHCQAKLDEATPSCWLEIERWGFEPLEQAPDYTLGKAIAMRAQNLIHSGSSSMPGLWHRSSFSDPLALDSAVSHPEIATQTDAIHWAIALLPDLLCHYDSPEKVITQAQQGLISQSLPSPQTSPIAESEHDFGHGDCIPASRINLTISSIDILRVLATVMMPILSGNPIPSTLMSDRILPTLSSPNSGILTSHLTAQLTWVEAAIAQQWSLEAVRRRCKGQNPLPYQTSFPSPTALEPVSVALYGFLSTPEDFRLSLLRVAQLEYCPQITCALTGMLSGAANGLSGLPLSWQRSLQAGYRQPNALSQVWGLDVPTLVELADQLLQVWSGVYTPSLPASPVVLAPRHPS